MNSALVVGYGSIGQRHSRILTEMGYQVALVTRQNPDGQTRFPNVSSAFSALKPDYVVVANETAGHYKTLLDLIKVGFSGPVLIEKPLFSEAVEIPDNKFIKLGVAYNLRFSPVMQELRKAIQGKAIISLSIYCGQHLSFWRPGRDYEKCYSASKQQGGGVLRDLSHDLDAALWLCGPWEKATACIGHFSELKINSEDVASIILETRNCPLVSVELNYLDRVSRREIIAHTTEHTYRVDLVGGIFEEDGIEKIMLSDKDYSYRAEHIAMLKSDASCICSAEEGLEINRLIEKLEEASVKKIWVVRSR